MKSRAAVFTSYGESTSKKLTGTLILLMFSLQNTYGGSIQQFLDSMVDEGFPRFKIPWLMGNCSINNSFSFIEIMKLALMEHGGEIKKCSRLPVYSMPHKILI